MLNTVDPEKMPKVYQDAQDELDIGELPQGTEYLLHWFLEIGSARSFTDNGPCPITYSDIINWKTLMEADINPLEVSILKQIDNIYISVVQESIARRIKK